MKYELLRDEKKEVAGHTLYRIRYVDGTLGGWLESEKNLDPDSNALVLDNACIYCNARVYDDARVYGKAHVADNAQVFGNALVYDEASVFGKARVYGTARMYDDDIVAGIGDISSDYHVYTT